MNLRISITILGSVLLAPVFLGVGYGYELKVHNSASRKVQNYPVEVAINELPPELQGPSLRLTQTSGKPLKSQLDDLDDDGEPEILLFHVSLKAGETKRLAVRKAPKAYDPKVVGEERAWFLWGEPNLENRWLRGYLPPARLPSDERPPRFPPDTPMPFGPRGNVEIEERRTGETLLDFALASTRHLVVEKVHQYAEAGPVRGMVGRTRRTHLRDEPEHSIRITQRYFIYEASRRIDIEVGLTNLEETAMTIPSGLRVFDARMGKVLAKNLGEVKNVAKEGGQLWQNPTAGYSLIYMPHAETESGFKMPSQGFGVDYFRFAPSIGPKIRLSGTETTLEPGGTDRFRCSFVLYHGGSEATQQRLAQLAAEASGAVSVYGEGEPIPVAAQQQPQEAADGGKTETKSRPEAPEPAWPLDGQRLTDISVMFTAPGEGAQMELQVARDKAFERIVIAEKRDRLQRLQPEATLGKGTYYWRARGLNRNGESGEWSSVRSFTVDITDHTPQPPVRPISPENPMFIGTKMPSEFVRGLSSHWPDSLKGMVVREKAGYNPGEAFPIPTLIKFGKGGTINLPKLEHAYRSSEKVIGFLFREYGINEAFLRPALTLGAVHGRYAGTLNIGWDLGLDSWLSEDYYDLMNRFSEYMLPVQKLTNRRFPLPRVLTPSGAYLAGRIGNFGIETEWGTGWAITGWNRDAKGDVGMTTRPLNWVSPLVTGVASGACVYRLEAVAKNRYMSAWHKGWNGYGPLWNRAMAPLFVDMLKHDLIPSRQEILDKVKVAMATKRRYGIKSPGSQETFFPNRILGALHGLPTESVPLEHVFENQWIPDSGTRYLVPVLPSYLSEQERRLFDHVLKPWEFDHPQDAVAYANRFYPPNPSEAYATLVGDTGIVINGIEERRDPNAGPQQFQLGFTKGPVAGVRGRINWQAYLLMKQKSDSLFLHVNNHKINYTQIEMKSRSGDKLATRVKPESALASKSWNEEEGTLTLNLNHYEGVDRVIVTRE